LLTVFAFAMHIVEDYITVGWNQHPWLPFSATTVNLADHLPNWVVQGAFQYTAMASIVGMSVWIYIRHRRTPLEIISPALDRLIVNYAVLPWRHHCANCANRAHFRCDRCSRDFCAVHSGVRGGLAIACSECRE
jgi:hypothetical protein